MSDDAARLAKRFHWITTTGQGGAWAPNPVPFVHLSKRDLEMNVHSRRELLDHRIRLWLEECKVKAEFMLRELRAWDGKLSEETDAPEVARIDKDEGRPSDPVRVALVNALEKTKG